MTNCPKCNSHRLELTRKGSKYICLACGWKEGTYQPPEHLEPHVCRLCGKLEKNYWERPTQALLTQHQICFSCNFWREKLAIRDQPTTVRADGDHFIIGQPQSDRHFSGYAGREFHIKFHDGRRVTTRNLWCQGEIPLHFRDQLPDNATFEE